jgi:hypothetical protein
MPLISHQFITQQGISHLPETPSGTFQNNLEYCLCQGREAKKAMRGWKNLGVVDTIYEEEEKEYEYSSASPSLSPTISSPPTPLHTRVAAW